MRLLSIFLVDTNEKTRNKARPNVLYRSLIDNHFWNTSNSTKALF